MEKIRAPFGSWPSSLTSDMVVSDAVSFTHVESMGKGIVFSERRPEEKGRSTLVFMEKGECKDLLPSEYNVRTTVHEYGGKSHLVDRETIYFSNFSDQQLYKRDPSGKITQLTNKKEARFADGCVFENFLIYVMERHGDEVENMLVAIDEKGSIRVIASGFDFYKEPRVSPDKKKLAYYRWNHPNMPWDGGELVECELNEDATLKNERVVSGGENESIAQLSFGPDSHLYYASDKSNWWNLYSQGRNLAPMEAEIGGPPWVFGQSYFDFLEDAVVFVFSKLGRDQLAVLQNGKLKILSLPFDVIFNVKAGHGGVYFIGSSPRIPSSIVFLDLSKDPCSLSVLKESRSLFSLSEMISEPEAISFKTDNDEPAYGFYYAPKNSRYEGPINELPPLLVLSHGGPTAHTTPRFNLAIQYWTSRGIAVVDVNYGGSSGYGRKFRNRLWGKWGVVDVNDCTNAALYLAKKLLVDAKRLAIAGGSAGGYTTLACLAFKNVFSVGASFYGVSDLEALTKDTHKFESRYLDRLIGPYPEAKREYVKRSPIHHVDQISCPVLFLQGEEDKIVPPSQSEKMYESLLKRKIPTAYLLFEKEQHGFRQSKNIKRALEAEYFFFAKAFGIKPYDCIEPFPISNSEKWGS